jgi:hypothetical protein
VLCWFFYEIVSRLLVVAENSSLLCMNVNPDFRPSYVSTHNWDESRDLHSYTKKEYIVIHPKNHFTQNTKFKHSFLNFSVKFVVGHLKSFLAKLLMIQKFALSFFLKKLEPNINLERKMSKINLTPNKRELKKL